MNTVCFVYLSRNAWHGFADLAGDIRSVTRPGDGVLVVDDGSTDDTRARIGRFGAFVGWGDGVEAEVILTGARAVGDHGTAVNVALSHLALPGRAVDRVIFLDAGSRLDPAPWCAARVQAEQDDLDLMICRMQAGAADLPVPGLGQMLMRYGLLYAPAELRCDEGHRMLGDLWFQWQITQRSLGRTGTSAWVTGSCPPAPDPDAETAALAAQLVQRDPRLSDWLAPIFTPPDRP